MGYLIKDIEDIVQATVTITQAELLAGSIIKVIPEYPATAGKAWSVLYFIGNFSGTAYTGASTIHIEANSANLPQYRFGANPLQVTPFFKFAPVVNSIVASTQFIVNKGLEVHSPTAYTLGTGDITLYMAAKLFTI
jgi:hypothetical protein